MFDVNETMRQAAAGVLGVMTDEEIETFVTEGYGIEQARAALPAAE